MRTDDPILDLAYTEIGTYRELRREVRELKSILDNPNILEECGVIYEGLDIDFTEKDIESLIANRESDISALKEKLERL